MLSDWWIIVLTFDLNNSFPMSHKKENISQNRQYQFSEFTFMVCYLFWSDPASFIHRKSAASHCLILWVLFSLAKVDNQISLNISGLFSAWWILHSYKLMILKKWVHMTKHIGHVRHTYFWEYCDWLLFSVVLLERR